MVFKYIFWGSDTWFFTQITVIKRPCEAECCIHLPGIVWNHNICVTPLTHWGRVTHKCVSKLTIIGSDDGLLPDWYQAIIWTNAGILLIRNLRTNSYVKFLYFHSKNTFECIVCQMGAILSRPQCVKAHLCLFTDQFLCYSFTMNNWISNVYVLMLKIVQLYLMTMKYHKTSMQHLYENISKFSLQKHTQIIKVFRQLQILPLPGSMWYITIPLVPNKIIIR